MSSKNQIPPFTYRKHTEASRHLPLHRKKAPRGGKKKGLQEVKTFPNFQRPLIKDHPPILSLTALLPSGLTTKPHPPQQQ
jgi:hypothetical protein